MKTTAVLALSGLGVPECLRWHEGALWFSDLAHGTVHRWDGTGEAETVLKVPGRAGGLGWLPDGRLLVVSMDEGRVYRREADGELVEHADLRHIVGGPVNDMLVDPQGRAYVGNFGFDYHAFTREHPNSLLYAPPGPPRTPVACLAPDGGLLGLTEPLLFPNGMLLTADGTAVVVAETLAMRLTRLPVNADGSLGRPQPWAVLISPVLWRLVNHPGLPGRLTRRVSALLDHPAVAKRSASPVAPDGIAWDTDGRTIWVANALRGECVRVAAGGRVLDRVATSRHTLSCLVAGHDGRTLFAATVPTDDPLRAAELNGGRIEMARL
ncbi:SMP-30/gluconolactonase/LRE family protein [Streptomyces pseudovenezuelae]|uniref:SMP-30/gluconolactonase/LRE family protein n=1 Tax=Streptomyces pseudovenezuelae TaxID=67350 RepID=UPI002E81E5BE|nr:SMP-30/gluconolactonase/LRE family protein [Streptomyces pseudovenezuelae]WUA86041.1 SMP-30/gluconolactonase/LRE family protein [Streptomyces pseudovenezuelae]